jgi:hypothetical protein
MSFTHNFGVRPVSPKTSMKAAQAPRRASGLNCVRRTATFAESRYCRESADHLLGYATQQVRNFDRGRNQWHNPAISIGQELRRIIVQPPDLFQSTHHRISDPRSRDRCLFVPRLWSSADRCDNSYTCCYILPGTAAGITHYVTRSSTRRR